MQRQEKDAQGTLQSKPVETYPNRWFIEKREFFEQRTAAGEHRPKRHHQSACRFEDRGWNGDVQAVVHAGGQEVAVSDPRGGGGARVLSPTP